MARLDVLDYVCVWRLYVHDGKICPISHLKAFCELLASGSIITLDAQKNAVCAICIFYTLQYSMILLYFCNLSFAFGVILMILPLAFIFVVSDYPLKNSNSFLYIIRMNRINWICSEIIFALKATATFLLLTVLICCGLGFSNGKMSLCWSNITVQYNVLFPKLKGSFVDQLLPGNLYNQMSLIKCFLLSFALVFLYLFTFSMIYLLFELKKRKGIGLLIIAAIILTGTVLTGIDNGGKWLLPTAHSIIWIHYTEYYRDSVMNIGYSFLYYILVNIVIIINAFMECKCYSFEAK